MKDTEKTAISKEWVMLSLLTLAAAIALLIISVSVCPCAGSIQTAAGGQVPMKCHWTQKAVQLAAVLPVILAVIQVFLKGKAARRVSCLALFFSAALVFLLTTDQGIGVCAAEGMACSRMALFVRLNAILLGAIGAVEILRAGARGGRPKRGF